MDTRHGTRGIDSGADGADSLRLGGERAPWRIHLVNGAVDLPRLSPPSFGASREPLRLMWRASPLPFEQASAPIVPGGSGIPPDVEEANWVCGHWDVISRTCSRLYATPCRLAVLDEGHASRVEVSDIPVQNAVRRELLFDVAAATEPPVATAMVVVKTETSMLEDTPKVNNQVNEGVIDAKDGGMEDVVNNGSQIDNFDGDQWATKDFVQKEIDLVVGLVEKQVEQMLEAIMIP